MERSKYGCWEAHLSLMRREGWKLVVVGHSLGAGVAALLSLKLLDQYPSALSLSKTTSTCIVDLSFQP